MNLSTEQAILDIVNTAALNRKLTIAVFYRVDSPIPHNLAVRGHRVLAVGENFRRIYKLWKKRSESNSTTLAIVESKENKPPIKRHSVDTLVLCDGLFACEPHFALKTASELLKPGGLFVWPHPSSFGLITRLSGAWPKPAWARILSRLFDYTTLLMKAGFRDIGQVYIPQRVAPWTITTGRAGARPWE